MVLILSSYEFLIYRLVSHRQFYNKAFNCAIAILPFFIATIVLALQSNIVITLGTIGALAILRFRTAIKDPIDMIYLLWSVHTGIICGCQLYEIGVLTSLVVTVMFIVLDHIDIGKKPFILMVRTVNASEEKIVKILRNSSVRYIVKSRAFSKEGVDYAIELRTKDPVLLTEALNREKCIERFSLLKYDADDIV